MFNRFMLRVMITLSMWIPKRLESVHIVYMQLIWQRQSHLKSMCAHSLIRIERGYWPTTAHMHTICHINIIIIAFRFYIYRLSFLVVYIDPAKLKTHTQENCEQWLNSMLMSYCQLNFNRASLSLQFAASMLYIELDISNRYIRCIFPKANWFVDLTNISIN